MNSSQKLSQVSEKPRILLIDGNNLGLRAMYGCHRLYDSEGTPTGCIMTFIRTMARVANIVKPLRTFVVWDGGRSAYRKSIFPGYKGSDREKDPNAPEDEFFAEWKVQAKLLEEYVPLLGVGSLRLSKCEADDVIYRLSQLLIPEYEVWIGSGDMDFRQIISDSIYQYDLGKNKVFDRAAVYEEKGVYPEQWVQYRSITGDSSDSIDGVRMLGPKRAAKLLQEFGNIENFLDRFVDKGAEDEWFAKTGNAYYKGIFDQIEKIDRNIALIDLSKFPLEELPVPTIVKKMEDLLQIRPDHKAMWNICLKHELKTLLDESFLWRELWKNQN